MGLKANVQAQSKTRGTHRFVWCGRLHVPSYWIRFGRKQHGYRSFGEETMATSVAISTTFLPSRPQSAFPPTRCQSRRKNSGGNGKFQKPISLTVRAAKLPPGVEMPKVEPKLNAPTLGFTQTAEIWNARACMIGLIGTFMVELIFHKGILQIIGIDVGKGLDLPL